MFLQVIQGRTSDADGIKRQWERWQEELRPGAVGYLGSTGGIAEDGTVVMFARFTDPEAAARNSDRAEQGAWWNEIAKYFDGEPSFSNFTDVQVTMADGRTTFDDAGFVQVMQGRVTDRAKLESFEAEFMPQMQEMRPDVMGSIRGWDGDRFTEAIYFTSEADARKGEASMTPDAGSDDAEKFAEFMGLMQDLTYVDVKEPWLRSA